MTFHSIIMIINLSRQHQIYKLALLFTLIFSFIVITNLSSGCVYSQEENKNLVVDYSKFNNESTKNNADNLFQMALNSQTDEERADYLKQSAAQYFILTNIDSSDTYSYIQLGRIYDMQGNDEYAKAYFYRALGINYKDADANSYFGDFYYKRKQFKKALEYYQKSISYQKNDAKIYKNVGHIYERFGDLPRANNYYKQSLELNPQDSELRLKINEAIREEYDKSGYYKRRLKN